MSINLLYAQDYEDDEIYYETEIKNRWVAEGGLNYFIPHNDFRRKNPDNHLGLDFTVLRQIQFSRIFLGLNYSSRRTDNLTIKDFEPETDAQLRSRNFNYSVIGRIYPQFYLSIFEFFGEAGAGLNVTNSITRFYDQIAGEYFSQETVLADYTVFFYGGGGFHVALDESWFLTGKAQTHFAPSTEFLKRRNVVPNVVFPIDAFEVTSAAYRATTISLSLTFIF